MPNRVQKKKEEGGSRKGLRSALREKMRKEKAQGPGIHKSSGRIHRRLGRRKSQWSARRARREVTGKAEQGNPSWGGSKAASGEHQARARLG